VACRRVVQIIVLSNELDVLEPPEHDPQHIVVGLRADCEVVLPEEVGDFLREVLVDLVLDALSLQLQLTVLFPHIWRILHKRTGHYVRERACERVEGGRNVRAHDCSRPVNRGGPFSQPYFEVIALHRLERMV